MKLSKLHIVITGALMPFILGVVGFLIAVYIFQWDSSFTSQVLKIFPLPALVINGNMVTLAEYRDQLKIDKKLISGGNAVIRTRKRMIKNALVQNLLKQYKIVIKDEEVDRTFNDIVDASGGALRTRKILDQSYGLDEDQFKKYVIGPFTAERILEERTNLDETFQKERLTLAKEILKTAQKESIILVGKTKKLGDHSWIIANYTETVKKEDNDFFNQIEVIGLGKIGLIKNNRGFFVAEVIRQREEEFDIRSILVEPKKLSDILEEKRREARVFAFIR